MAKHMKECLLCEEPLELKDATDLCADCVIVSVGDEVDDLLGEAGYENLGADETSTRYKTPDGYIIKITIEEVK